MLHILTNITTYCGKDDFAMKFNKQQIGEFKAKCRYYITWRKNLKPNQIMKYFYDEDISTIRELFPGKNLEYCNSYMYDIVWGDYQQGLKYSDENGTYYMFWSANSFGAPPQSIAVGKAVDGKIYFIREHFPRGEYNLNFREIPEEYINRVGNGFRPKSYNHTIYAVASCIEEITDKDVNCLKNAYEGIKAFSKLIGEKI